MIADYLRKNEMTIRDVFDTIDEESNGFISKKQFMQFLKTID